MVLLETNVPSRPSAKFYFTTTLQCQEFLDTMKEKGVTIPWKDMQVQKDFTEMTEKQRTYANLDRSGRWRALDVLDWAYAFMGEIYPEITGHQRITADNIAGRRQPINA